MCTHAHSPSSDTRVLFANENPVQTSELQLPQGVNIQHCWKISTALTNKAGDPTFPGFPGCIETGTRPSQDWKLGMSAVQPSVASTSPKVTFSFNHCLRLSRELEKCLFSQGTANCFSCFLQTAITADFYVPTAGRLCHCRRPKAVSSAPSNANICSNLLQPYITLAQPHPADWSCCCSHLNLMKKGTDEPKKGASPAQIWGTAAPNNPSPATTDCCFLLEY